MPTNDESTRREASGRESIARVLITREDPEPVCEAVRNAGGEPFELALLVTRWSPFEIPAGRSLDDYDWVAFTSARALNGVARRAVRDAWNWPPRTPAAAVGDRTAHELQARGWMPECVSTGTGARGLVQALRPHVKPGMRVLFPCSALADSTLPDGMRDCGALCDVVHVYNTETAWQRKPDRKRELAKRLQEVFRSDCIPTCASPSAVRALVEVADAAGLNEQLRGIPLVVLGPTTAKAARALNLNPIDAGGHGLAHMARRAVELARNRIEP